jgi:hypothetical protein
MGPHAAGWVRWMAGVLVSAPEAVVRREDLNVSGSNILLIIVGLTLLVLLVLLLIGPATAMMGGMMMMASTPVGAAILLIVLALVGLFAYSALFARPG